MNKIQLIIALVFALSLNSHAQKPGYDSTYAKKLKAEDYGMKPTCL